MFSVLSSTSAADGARRTGMQRVLQLVPGVCLSSVIAMAAIFMSVLHGGPQFLYALFFGVAFHFLSHDEKTRSGIEFCTRSVLRLGVGLLGARITAAQIAGLGWSAAAIVIAAVVTRYTDCTGKFMLVRTEPNHHGGYSYPKPMADSARLESPPWRTKLCNRR